MAVNAKVASAYVDLVARTAAFKAALEDATNTTKKFAAETRAQMNEAKGSIALLGETVGVTLPRHLRTFVAGLPGVATAMSAAFDAVAVIALIDFVYKAGEKVVEFVRKNEEAARKNADACREFTGEMVKSNAQLAVANDRLENDIAKLSHKPENNLKLALDEAKLSAIDLAEKLEKATTKERELLDAENANWFQRLTGTVGTDSVKSGLNKYQQDYREINSSHDAQLQSARSLNDEQAIEADRKQKLLALSQAYYNALTKEIAVRQQYQALRDSGDLNTDEAWQFELKYGGGDQGKILPALKNLQGQIGVGATGLSLELHHDQLEQQDSALQGEKAASDNANKAAQERLRQFETAFAQQKALYGMDVAEERAYWQSKLASFKVGSSEYLSVLEKYNKAAGELSKSLEAMRKSTIIGPEPAPGLKPLDHGSDQYAEAVARGIEQQAALKAALTETTTRIDLMTGAIGPHEAALALAAAHAADYQAKLKALTNQLAVLRSQEMTDAGGNNLDPENAAKQQTVKNQIAELTGKAQIQALTDAQATLSTTWRGMIDGVFDELVKKSQDTEAKLRQITESVINSINTELAKGMTGGKMDFKRVFQSGAQELAKTGLEKAEGIGLQLLGLGGHRKADGYHTWVDNLPGASTGGLLPPGIADLFKSTPPTVIGPNGQIAGAGASVAATGLLGWLNNSNWASSLFGGRLFGSGSFFGGGHALGGDVMAGVPIDVGEMGRERFVPSTPGRIVPHSQLGGGDTWNIDARGTDPALTRENFERALAANRQQATHDAAMATAERNRRIPH